MKNEGKGLAETKYEQNRQAGGCWGGGGGGGGCWVCGKRRQITKTKKRIRMKLHLRRTPGTIRVGKRSTSGKNKLSDFAKERLQRGRKKTLLLLTGGLESNKGNT